MSASSLRPLLSLLLGASLLAAFGASPETLRVRAGEKISAALEKAPPGSTIEVEPGVYHETLVVDTIVSDVTRASVTFAHVLCEKVTGQVVVEGSARLAVTGGHGKVKRLDKTIVAALQSPPQPS